MDKEIYYLELLKKSKEMETVYRRVCQESLSEYAFSPSEIDVLLFLAKNDSHDTAKDIIESRGISKSLVCRSVDSLVKKGYLHSIPDRWDKRVMHLKVDAAAGTMLIPLMEARKIFFDEIFQGITAEELELYLKINKKILDNLKKY